MTDAVFLPRKDLSLLFDLFRNGGYAISGPSVADGVIRIAPLAEPAGLPWGVADEQDAGRYRLTGGPAGRAFSWTTAPQAGKPLTFPSREALWEVRRDDDGRLHFSESKPEPLRRAVIGLRGCDLAALELQDRHFYAGGDSWYRARRNSLLIVAVNCARSAATCFCASTGDGPSVQAPHDLLLDELDEGYVIRPGSSKGAALLADTGWAPASHEHLASAASQIQAAANAQTRRLPDGNLEPALDARRKSPAWQDIAGECLACGNCTAVCPSCFCHRHTEQPALDASMSAHAREWDSCFSNDHSLMHGQPHRREIAHRYRQWLGHKLGAWHTQYGRSGCTGCGRCITWCPVAIDLTASVAAIVGETPP